MRRRSFPALALAAVLALGAALLVGAHISGARDGSGAGRQADVAARGAEVMPFDLERTTHVFAKRANGGVQTVVADDPDDAEQVALVRAHLRKEAAKFRRGELDDPARIHGMEMPGLAELQRGVRRIAIVYADVAAGGQIHYRTDDRALVAALHHWFNAQTSDHGGHAEART